MKPFALLALALALLGAGCAAARQTQAPATSATHAISCYDDWALAINRLRKDGVTRAQLAETLPAHVPTTARMEQLITYLYDGPQRTHYEATQQAQHLCHEARQDASEVTPTVYVASQPRSPTFGQRLAGAIILGIAAGAAESLSSSYWYTSSYTYRTSYGRRTVRTSCYYGRYHSSCKTR